MRRPLQTPALLKRLGAAGVEAQVGTRNASIFLDYYGFCGSETHTLAELAAEYGVSKERIRQIVARTAQRIGLDLMTEASR